MPHARWSETCKDMMCLKYIQQLFVSSEISVFYLFFQEAPFLHLESQLFFCQRCCLRSIRNQVVTYCAVASQSSFHKSLTIMELVAHVSLRELNGSRKISA